jgi:hypothetical protein
LRRSHPPEIPAQRPPIVAAFPCAAQDTRYNPATLFRRATELGVRPMSYDLDFWRYKPGTVLDHQAVYESLSDGKVVEGLEEIPIAQMLARVREEFTDWTQLDDVSFDGGDHGSFELYTTPQFFRVDCYGKHGEDMNRLIEIANEFKCPLFDPQVGKRYDSA